MKVSKSSKAIALLVVIAFTLVACGSDPASKNQNPNTTEVDCTDAKNAGEQKCIDEEAARVAARAAAEQEAARIAAEQEAARIEKAKKTAEEYGGLLYLGAEGKPVFAFDPAISSTTNDKKKPQTYFENLTASRKFPLLFSSPTTGQSEEDEYQAFYNQLKPFDKTASGRDPGTAVAKTYQGGNYLSLYLENTSHELSFHYIFKIYDYFLIPISSPSATSSYSVKTVYIQRDNYTFLTNDILNVKDVGDAYTLDNTEKTNRAKGSFTLTIDDVAQASAGNVLAFNFSPAETVKSDAKLVSAKVSNFSFAPGSDEDKLKGIYKFNKNDNSEIKAEYVSGNDSCASSSDCLSSTGSIIVFAGVASSHVGGTVIIRYNTTRIHFAGKKTTPTSTSE